ncbi:MAG: hypothetical protein C0502_00310 [Opitutus sp.]|nr:hypothetical protein [Opitutus sp.]
MEWKFLRPAKSIARTDEIGVYPRIRLHCRVNRVAAVAAGVGGNIDARLAGFQDSFRVFIGLDL